jgi:hypothetical protein
MEMVNLWEINYYLNDEIVLIVRYLDCLLTFERNQRRRIVERRVLPFTVGQDRIGIVLNG